MLTHRITCLDCGRIAVTELELDKCPYCSSSEIQKESSKRSDSPLKAVYFDKLNSDQQKIVLATEGVNYVNAGPGTAKSTTLAARAKYIALARRDNIHHPLILTFTREAADHIANILSLSKSDMPVISTIHSFAYHKLRQYLPESEDLYDIDLQIISPDMKRLILQDIHHLFPKYTIEELGSKIALCKKRYEYAESLLKGTPHPDPLLDIYLDEQRKYDSYDFDDLINLLCFMLEYEDDIAQKIQEEYQYVLVDEAQDLTNAELKLLNLITAKYRNLFLVGDEDQSIYAWRGASNNIRHWLKTLGCRNSYFTLTTNYRSTPAIINTANTLISNNKGRADKEIIPYKDNGVKVLIKECDTPQQEAKMIASAIELVTDKKSLPISIKYKDIAVLARTNAQLKIIKRELLKKKIPVVNTIVPLLHTEESMTIFRYLAFLNTLDYFHFAALDEQAVDDEHWDEFMRDYILANRSVFNGLNRWYSENKPLTAQGDLLLELINSNIGVPAHKALKAVMEYKKIDPCHPMIKALLKRWKKYLNWDCPLNLLVEDWLLAIQEEDTVSNQGNFVRLQTIHGAKGKEYKKVFLCGVSGNILPGPDADLQEERRLFYVGITRAEKELTISYPTQIFGKAVPVSIFINEIRDCPSVIFSKNSISKKRTRK